MIDDPQLKTEIDQLEKNEQLKVTFEKKKKAKTPPYMTLGNGLTIRKFNKDDIVDALEVFGSLTSSQQKIVLYFKNQMVKTQSSAHYAKQTLENPNLVSLPKSKNDEDATEIRRLLRQNGNGKTLADKVLRKINNTQFMLNPFMFIPSHNFDKAEAIWKGLAKESEQESVSED